MYGINEWQYEKSYQDIYESVVSGHAAKRNHAVLFLGGQPGAGKSSFYQMDDNFSDYIVINGDQYRKFHPYYEKMVQSDRERMPELTQPFVNRIVEGLIDKLSTEGYNLIIEGTLREADVPVRTGKMLKEKGYSTELYVVACDARKSWESTINRAKLMQEIGEVPRIVPIGKYDYIVGHICENLKMIEASGCMDRITVLGRDSEIFWRDGKGICPSVSQSLEKILNLPAWRQHLEQYEQQYEGLLGNIREPQAEQRMPFRGKGR